MDYFFLGDAELVTAFRFIGIEGMAVRDSEETVAVFRKITVGWHESSHFNLPENLPVAGNCKILIITEEVADWLGDYMVNWQLEGQYPLLVELPGINGKLHDKKTLVDSIREAIGIYI